MLSQVTTGKIKRPPLVLVYGVDGVGKTSFAAEAPKPIFLGPEAGTDNLDVARFPVPESWDDIIKCLKELRDDPHAFKSLAIDSLDWLEPIIWAKICKDENAKSIERACGGYGKGYGEAEKYWTELRSLISEVRNKRGMAIILIAHSQTVTNYNPVLQVELKKYELKLHKIASAKFREWVDAVLFANFDSFAKKVDDEVKIFGTDRRYLYSTRTEAFEAKNRYGINPLKKVELGWTDFENAVRAANPEDPTALKAKIEALKALVTDLTKLPVIDDSVTKAGNDPVKLARIAERLEVITAPKEDVT